MKRKKKKKKKREKYRKYSNAPRFLSVLLRTQPSWNLFFQGVEINSCLAKRPCAICLMRILKVNLCIRGWSGGAMVLGKLPVPGRPTIWMIVGQGPIALAVGVGGGCLDIFTLIYPFSPPSPSLWETARYRLKYCLKGPLNPKQPTNQSVH